MQLKEIIENINKYIQKENQDKTKLILEIQDYFKDLTQDKINSEDPKEIKKLINCHSILMKKKLRVLDYAQIDYYINEIPKYYSYYETHIKNISKEKFKEVIKIISNNNLLNAKQNKLELLAFVGSISLYSMELQDTIITTSQKDLRLEIDFNLKSEMYLLIIGSRNYENRINKIKKDIEKLIISFH